MSLCHHLHHPDTCPTCTPAAAPSPTRYADLTPAERRSLHLANRKGGAQVVPPFHPVARTEIPAQVARTLVLRDLLQVGPTGTAIATRAGRAELERPLPPDPAVLLKEGHGLTTRPDLAVRDDAGEVADTDALDRVWGQDAARRHRAAQDPRAAAARAAARARGAR